MNNRKIISTLLASLLMVVMCFTATNTCAQTKTEDSKTKDCCMMKDGKMMLVKDGTTMPMEKDITMKNGTKCMTNGKCVMKDGKTMLMTEGQCMDMNGKMDKCSMMNTDIKSSTDKKTDDKESATTYTCPMHPDVTSDKTGQCPICGMDLVEKK